MKLFSCSHCGNTVFFENSHCENCKNRLGYDSQTSSVRALSEESGEWREMGGNGAAFRFCANESHGVCNWLIPALSTEAFCAACRHNHTVPDLSFSTNLTAWRKIEFAKHHMFYGLLRLGLPLETRLVQPTFGLMFEFLADEAHPSGHVLTGHDDGIITLNLSEADDAEREKRRTQMNEPYRTILGHFRHEIGHYYWDRLVRDGGRLEECRAIFGDESVDYNEALKTYYANGPLAGWSETFISAYATCHPWEDFAETWAHYLHIIDTLEMAESYGIQVRPLSDMTASASDQTYFDPHLANDITQIMSRWFPVAAAVNSVNRCMGQPDLYPFVLTPAVVSKLDFIHKLVHRVS